MEGINQPVDFFYFFPFFLLLPLCFSFFFFFNLGHSKFMENFFLIFFNFEKVVKITQRSRKSESKTNALWSPVKSYESLEFLKTPMLNLPSYSPLERCHPGTLHRWKDGKAKKETAKRNPTMKRKLKKTGAALYVGNGPEYKPFHDFRPVQSAHRPRAQSQKGLYSDPSPIRKILVNSQHDLMKLVRSCF